ncbi:MAG: HEAT repeat domain-containing protein [Roseibacillus sp.]|jgi:HEAT repeat protein|nr:HEAT repeat domain-containing protein [Roseibacillus sp.]HJM62324.1 HEAT repeat domain-containing protein [Roseibacillus sp.]|tara:strand:- start:15302 stop:19228 length:3927 start_codon:yes stop_codon:yes gene_type:complete
MTTLQHVFGFVSLTALSLTVATAAPLGSSAPHSSTPLEKASWIWGGNGQAVVQLRTTLSLAKAPTAASISITADNGYELYINGTAVGFDIGSSKEIWGTVERYDITSRLSQGTNIIGIRGTMLGGSCGVVAAARIETRGEAPRSFVTNASWRATGKGSPDEYSHPEFVEDSSWSDATVMGPMGMAPWGTLTASESKGQRRPKALPGSIALTQPGEDFSWPEGVAFIGDDCSVYKPLRGDAWGVCFRIGEWTRAYTEFDLPCPSKTGRKLYTLKPAPGAKPRLLFDAGTGVIGSPSVSYDGKFIHVAMAMEGENFFHIYRIPSGGGTPQRLTAGPFHDIDPAELPDGRIVFTSTRIGTFEEYHNPPSRSLFVMSPDGSDIQPLTFTPNFDNEPKVLADGRIAFIRTDNFFDRAKVETRIHVIHPDGTRGQAAFGANQGADYGVRLRKFGFGSPAPMPDGRLACISNRGNFIANPGDVEPTYHKLPGGLGDLTSLPDGRLLCTVLRPTGNRMLSDVLAVIDPHDNRVISIHESSSGSVHSPVFLGARPRPPVVTNTVNPEQVGQPGTTGFLFCQDVRNTRKKKADWEQVRAIRVLAAKALTTRSSHSHIVHAGHETVELGTVPLAPDGSFFVEVPADTPLSLQAVDAEGRSELNEMSWISVRPGERRSCVGCHQPQSITPLHKVSTFVSKETPPLKLLGQGQPYRFRGNNSGVTGMMDLQFERFRETASLNRHAISDNPLATGRDEIALLIGQLRDDDEGRRISATQRLAIFHERSAAAALETALGDRSREVRVGAAMALAACGTRDSIPALLKALQDHDELVIAAADIALGNLVAHQVPLSSEENAEEDKSTDSPWHAWFKTHRWDAIEESLVNRLQEQPPLNTRRTVVALGHIGGERARAALRDFVERERKQNPYAPFVRDNRTDRFTFDGSSPLNPRTLQEAVRALGYLQDTGAIDLLSRILADNIEPKNANLFLAEAAVEALGRIGTPNAESVLIDTFRNLKNYWEYVGWYSDHPALYACHNSPLHARLIEALDALGSTRTADILPHLIRSLPTDPDRALFPENDDYEILVGRIIRRSGRREEVIETCLSLLGDPRAKAAVDLKQAISTVHPAWAGTPDPDNRAAQLLSMVCRDQTYEPRLRQIYTGYRSRPEDPIARPLGNPKWIPQRHWVLFYLGRSLGNLADPRSVDTLLASLKPELNEARHGHPDPAEPNIHFLHLEYTPCWRASAAWALGRIGDKRAATPLLDVVRNLKNATDVRHAAAEALGILADPETLEKIRLLARDYPEHSTRLVLREACTGTAGNQ